MNRNTNSHFNGVWICTETATAIQWSLDTNRNTNSNLILHRSSNNSDHKLIEEFSHAENYLHVEMGLDIKRLTERNAPLNFTKDEINYYVRRFKLLDGENKGYISINDLRRYFKNIGEKVPEDQLHEILTEVDLNRNAQVDLGEFLQLMSAIQHGFVVNNRFAKAAELNEVKVIKDTKITVERSGGGV